MLRRCDDVLVKLLERLQFDHHRRVLEHLLSELERDPDVIGAMLAGSVARGDALPGSDLDLHLLLEDGLSRAFHSEARDGVQLELHAHDLEHALEHIEQRPSWGYAYLDGLVLFDSHDQFGKLRVRARTILESYCTPEHERRTIAYWLESSARKTRAALEARDPVREGMIASTTAWKVLEGMFAANDQPMPASGAILGRVRQLENVPEDFEGMLERIFTGDHEQRVAQTLELMEWVSRRLRTA